MKALPLCLILLCGTLYGQSPETSPLTPEERRLVLGQLYELQSCREEVSTYKEYVSREAEQDAREQKIHKAELDLRKRETTIVEKERDLALEKAELYKGLYDGIKKGPGWGCRLKRIFSFGLHRCQ